MVISLYRDSLRMSHITNACLYLRIEDLDLIATYGWIDKLTDMGEKGIGFFELGEDEDLDSKVKSLFKVREGQHVDNIRRMYESPVHRDMHWGKYHDRVLPVVEEHSRKDLLEILKERRRKRNSRRVKRR